MILTKPQFNRLLIVSVVFLLMLTGCSRETYFKILGWQKVTPPLGEVKENPNSGSVSDVVLTFPPDESFTLIERGGTCFLQGKNSEAVSLVKKGVKLDPDNLFILERACSCLVEFVSNEQKDYIFPLLNKMNALNEQSKMTETAKADYFVAIGSIYSKLKDYPDAIKDYEKALALQPDDMYLEDDKKYYLEPGLHQKYKDMLNNAKREQMP